MQPQKSGRNSNRNYKEIIQLGPRIQKLPRYGSEKQERKQEDTNNLQITPTTSLREQLKQLQEQGQKKKQQAYALEKMIKIQTFKNIKLKDQIAQTDKEYDVTKLQLGLEMLQQNKNNKESPLFYNQNGLAPFQFTLIAQKRFAGQENLICMICFQDIRQNQHVFELPCHDIMHKDCGMQHFLGSRYCPSCSQQMDVNGASKKRLQFLSKH